MCLPNCLPKLAELIPELHIFGIWKVKLIMIEAIDTTLEILKPSIHNLFEEVMILWSFLASIGENSWHENSWTKGHNNRA